MKSSVKEHKDSKDDNEWLAEVKCKKRESVEDKLTKDSSSDGESSKTRPSELGFKEKVTARSEFVDGLQVEEDLKKEPPRGRSMKGSKLSNM